MRLFLAIDLPLEVKRKLYDQLTPIQKEYPQIAWVPLENYHLTIEFFGEILPEKLIYIQKKIEDTLYDQEEFYLYGAQCDLFIANKITMFLTFHREKSLEQLVEKIRKNVVVDDVPRKKFLAHLSIGKTRIPSKQQYHLLKKKIERLSIDIEFPVSEVVLFQSILKGKTPEYRKLHAFSLLKK